MTKFLSRSLLSLWSVALLGLAGLASAQTLTISDSTSTKATTCTTYSVTGGSTTTISFQPSGCLGLTEAPPPSGADPVFSVRLEFPSTTQPTTATTGVQTVRVFVDADRDVPTGTTYNLTFNLCTSAQNCTSAGSGNWYFFRYSELGGAGFTPLDSVTSGSFAFSFQPGANTLPANPRSMGVGHMDVPNSPLFQGARSVMFSLSGTQANTSVVTHVITGGLLVAGTDLDINGQPIPNTPLSTTTYWQCELLGQPGSPGPIPNNPCGAYEIPVGDCSTGMTGANAVTRAYLLQVEDYVPTSYRIGNSLRMGFARDSAMVFKFRTGSASAFSLPRTFGVAYEEQVNRGPSAPRFMSVSEKKCDFDYTKLYTGTDTVGKSGCFKSDTGGGAITGFITATGADPAFPFPYCQLKPDTFYYVNIRWENAGVISQRGAISCPTAQNAYNACGTAMGFQ